MCGIAAVLRRSETGRPPLPEEVYRELAAALEAVPTAVSAGSADLSWAAVGTRLTQATLHATKVNRELTGAPGTRCLVRNTALRERLVDVAQVIESRVTDLEGKLDEEGADFLSPARIEALNEALAGLKDQVWSLRRDRVKSAEEVENLLGSLGSAAVSSATLDALSAIALVLSALDRMEVRGRDSAGIHLLISGHGLDCEAPEVCRLLGTRGSDPLFTSGAVRWPQGHISLVYKAAAEIGELGDNGKVLRKALQEDPLLHLALASESVEVRVLGHTRWASVGLINQANAHPLNHEELPDAGGPYVVAALNGDVDNYADLKATEGLSLAKEITTDAKVIPVLLSRKLKAGLSLEEAFLATVSSFQGSVAIASMTAEEPDRLLLAQRGSGQSLYLGLSQDCFIVASEPYGVVEQTSTYLRMDGETPGNPQNPSASRGQILLLDGRQAGSLKGVQRFAYDGTPLPIELDELQQAEITTRDVDRGPYPHYLLKEISEASRSFRKTLRGRVREEDGELKVSLGKTGLPPDLKQRLRRGSIRRFIAIGQGTAAVAGAGVAMALSQVLGRRFSVEAMPATELSGFGLQEDMSDTLVVAISQSGTTTDTNRTVDLVRSRGASVLSIVNRRHSDLTEKSDAVVYTSNGRDVEMSVASTKAFYSQIAAGFLLAFALAEEVGGSTARGAWGLESSGKGSFGGLLAALRELPEAMERVLDQHDHISEIARRYAPGNRYWAVVGNGHNRIAAQEIRIKLSELCYKSIACDTTEDKKHIDLSSEPLILVCAAGLTGSTATDVAKEVAIYRAHKATPIVIATEGEDRFSAAVELIPVPKTHPALAFVLTTVVGHLFGYEAALAIDDLARPLREARAAIESLVSSARLGEDLLRALRPKIQPCAAQFMSQLRQGAYNGNLEASTAVNLASLLRYAEGTVGLDSYRSECGKPGNPSIIVEDLTEALTRAIEELTRPIDAIKHQAKTVTVGISRTDEALLTVPLVRELIEVGIDRDRISYQDLRTLAALDPAVRKVLGYTRYRVEGDPEQDSCAIRVIDAGGISQGLPSRTDQQPVLRGTKRMVALERRLLAARGLADGRTFLLLPELEGNTVAGLILLHVLFHDHVPPATMRSVLGEYRRRYAVLRDAVMETEPSFREDLLGRISVTDLLTAPVHRLAENWRSQIPVAGEN